jgi:hypothetical protein
MASRPVISSKIKFPPSISFLYQLNFEAQAATKKKTGFRLSPE